jgi:hypothetical protein
MKIESVTYQLDWSKFRRGQSFFVPCIDHEKAKNTVYAVAKRLGVSIEIRVVIEEGIKGLRVWKV